MSEPGEAAGSHSQPGGSDAERVVVLGRIGGAFGVHGWVKVASYTDPIENILGYGVWLVGAPGRWRPMTLEDGRTTAKGVLAKLAGVETSEEARLYTGCEVDVPRSELPPAGPGEHYWSDLEGLQALTKDGEPLGRVDHFRSTPSGAVVVVRGEREHWIPLVKDRIVSVDLEAGRIVFDWGLDW